MSEDQARSVDKPTDEAPDAGKAYDPSMTDADEANIPPDSKADPKAAPEAEHQARRSDQRQPDGAPGSEGRTPIDR